MITQINNGKIASKDELIAGGTPSGILIRMSFLNIKCIISTQPIATKIAVKIPWHPNRSLVCNYQLKLISLWHFFHQQ